MAKYLGVAAIALALITTSNGQFPNLTANPNVAIPTTQPVQPVVVQPGQPVVVQPVVNQPTNANVRPANINTTPGAFVSTNLNNNNANNNLNNNINLNNNNFNNNNNGFNPINTNNFNNNNNGINNGINTPNPLISTIPNFNNNNNNNNNNNFINPGIINTATSGVNQGNNNVDQFSIGSPIITSATSPNGTTPPSSTSVNAIQCAGNLSPCHVGTSWLCIDSTLMLCGQDLICPAELPRQCRLASGQSLCYSPSVFECTRDGELLVIPTVRNQGDNSAVVTNAAIVPVTPANPANAISNANNANTIRVAPQNSINNGNFGGLPNTANNGVINNPNFINNSNNNNNNNNNNPAFFISNGPIIQ
jgi:hypothetical protein